jgi:hypothetical protein
VVLAAVDLAALSPAGEQRRPDSLAADDDGGERTLACLLAATTCERRFAKAAERVG